MKDKGFFGRGFTLVEVMLAVVVLSLGTGFLYKTFFTLLDAHGFCRNHLEANLFALDKLWEAQQKLWEEKVLPLGSTTGEHKGRAKVFNWKLSIAPLSELEDIYKVNLNLSWQEPQREVSFEKTTYVAR
ncbi:MAG: prepilin-type N-terminal cleavage/methylation domain-containing protein [Candidatus Omnitrophota bacterium]